MYIRRLRKRGVKDNFKVWELKTERMTLQFTETGDRNLIRSMMDVRSSDLDLLN